MRWNKLFAYLPIETEIKKHQNDYYSSINRSNGEGNCNAFIEFMLTMIDDALSVALLSTAKETKSISINVTRLLKVMDNDLPISAKEIMKRLAIKSKETLRKSYLDPALENGLVKMTIPDKPKSKNQKYYK